jgi:hypothetical protein
VAAIVSGIDPSRVGLDANISADGAGIGSPAAPAPHEAANCAGRMSTDRTDQPDVMAG